MKVLTLQEAVELYGNEKQKQMIVAMKGNLKANSFDSLLKTIQQHYESVMIGGRGSKFITCVKKIK